MGKVRIYCSGCTEHLGLVDFLTKLNNKKFYEFNNFLGVCKPSKSQVKRDVKQIGDKLVSKSETTGTGCFIMGSSGDDLVKKAITELNTLFKRGNRYDSVLFIDDLDHKPFKTIDASSLTDVEYMDKIKSFDNNILDTLSNNTPFTDFIVLHAIPEIESWFLYCYDEAIVEYYGDKEFTNALKKYLYENIFCNSDWDRFEYWCKYSKEKLSKPFIDAFSLIQYVDSLEVNESTMPNMKYLGRESLIARYELQNFKEYNKKKEGPEILKIINPNTLKSKSEYLNQKFDLIAKIQ